MSTLGDDILRACQPFKYGSGHTSHDGVAAKPCAKDGCERPRHVTYSGIIKAYCKQCCAMEDRKWRAANRKKRSERRQRT
jgi:hypothetical protein